MVKTMYFLLFSGFLLIRDFGFIVFGFESRHISCRPECTRVNSDLSGSLVIKNLEKVYISIVLLVNYREVISLVTIKDRQKYYLKGNVNYVNLILINLLLISRIDW